MAMTRFARLCALCATKGLRSACGCRSSAQAALSWQPSRCAHRVKVSEGGNRRGDWSMRAMAFRLPRPLGLMRRPRWLAQRAPKLGQRTRRVQRHATLMRGPNRFVRRLGRVRQPALTPRQPGLAAEIGTRLGPMWRSADDDHATCVRGQQQAPAKFGRVRQVCAASECGGRDDP